MNVLPLAGVGEYVAGPGVPLSGERIGALRGLCGKLLRGEVVPVRVLRGEYISGPGDASLSPSDNRNRSARVDPAKVMLDLLGNCTVHDSGV